MLLRLTPQNALTTARQLSQDLARWLEEAGNIGPAPRFRETLGELQATLDDGWLGVDCAGEPKLLEQTFEQRALPIQEVDGKIRKVSLLRRSGGFLVRTIDLAQPPADRAGSLAYPMLIFASQGDTLTAETVDSYMVDRPIAILLGPRENVLAEWASEPWSLECATTQQELDTTAFGRLLTSAGDALFDALQAYSVVTSLDSLSTGMDLAIDSELRGLKAKKALVQQRVTRSQQRTGVGNPATELVAELRGKVQRQFSDFERGVNDRLQQLFVPQVGAISQRVDQQIEAALKTLESGKQGGKLALAISDESEARLMDGVRAELAKEFAGDLGAMRDLFRLVQAEIEQFLESKGAPPIVMQFQYLTEDRANRLLENTMLFQRRYSGELRHGGIFETVMASRRYLSILFMALSSFGLLSYFRRSPVIMLPVTFLVLTIGALLAVNSSRKDRLEGEAKELEKARELMRTEFRRMFSDVQRGWSSILQTHLQDQLANTLARTEAALRDFQTRQSGEASDEKQRIQRQLQNLETVEKRLQTAAKGRETVGKNISQARGELKQLVISLLRPSAEAPAAAASARTPYTPRPISTPRTDG